MRYGIRRWLRVRLVAARGASSTAELVAAMRAGTLTPLHASPAEELGEVPAAFFEQVCGPHLMDSCCFWPEGIETLADAEAAALALTCERAMLADGQRILELGCRWGSLSLWMARRYPASRIVAVCQSQAQRAFIESRRLRNLEVVTAALGDFATGRRFDRIVTVETLEHLWNWELLFSRISEWLERDGKLFVQLACNANQSYPILADDLPPWIPRRCFEGLVPSADLIDELRSDLAVEARWLLGGEHYARTAEAWRVRLEARREWVVPILALHHGSGEASRRYHRWRLWFLSCAELFAQGEGREWGIAHYRLGKP